MENPALERAIKKFSSTAEMARQLGVSYQAIQDWRKRGRVPSDRCPLLSELTGESRDDLVGWPPVNVTDRIKASDDAQPPVGDPDDKLSKMAVA
jgi:DNA-binding transcriptional regulator YdaS (Cro superfamily)